jgi:hypothetical protein
MSRRTSTATIVQALRVLAADIRSDDGVASATCAEAADRLDELVKMLRVAAGTPSHERWSTDFRGSVERAIR